jgi:hypothetical protein
MYQNTTAIIYFNFSSHLLNCIILLASSDTPMSPQQIYVCSFCVCNKFNLIYLFVMSAVKIDQTDSAC